MKGLFRAVGAKWAEAPSLSTSITGGIHANRVPQEYSPPYVRFTMMGNAPEWDFKATTTYEFVTVMFGIFDTSPDPDDVLGYADTLRDRFEWASLTFAEGGYTSLLCERINEFLTEDEAPEWAWHYVINFTLRYRI